MLQTLALLLALGPTEHVEQPRRVEARTEKGHGGRDYHFDLEAQTNVPIDVGVRLSAEFPFRLRLSTSMGGTPGGYVDIINAIVMAADGYDDATAIVLREALRSALVWRTHFGWRPLRYYGFYFEGGYGLAALSGDLSSGDVAAVVTSNAATASTGNQVYALFSRLHMVDLEVGYQFLAFHDHLSIRTALGYAGAVASATTVDANQAPTPAGTRIREQSADDLGRYLDDEIFGQYLHTLVVSVAFGHRFF